jgi:hypothetical protein
MTFRQGLVAARTSLLMIAAFITGLTAIALLERWDPSRRIAAFEFAPDIPVVRPRPLTEREQRWARTAWRYFERNVRPDTGLVDSVDQYPAATLWDTGSYLMALIAAERLGLIPVAEFDSRVTRALDSLSKLPLYDGEAPNKSYNTVALAMVDYDNRPSARGIGWSAIDVGRFLVPCNILAWRYPQHTSAVRAVLSRWNWHRLVRDGVLYGAAFRDGKTVYLQEGRLGYEEYGAKPFALAGFDVSEAQRVDDFLRFVDVDGVRVATDSRGPEDSGTPNSGGPNYVVPNYTAPNYVAPNYVASEPYILDGLEFGFDRNSREFAWRVARAQEARFRKTGILTAVSEDHIDTAPYFVYNTVFTNGRVWNTVTPDGVDAREFKTLSTKAAIGWHALYATPYTQRLVDRVEQLFDADKGWYSGVFEATGKPNKAITANTNAIVLESLCYTQLGPLLKSY